MDGRELLRARAGITSADFVLMVSLKYPSWVLAFREKGDQLQ